MASNKPKNILLSGDPVVYEAVGSGAIKPGHLLKLQSTGKVAVHGTAAGAAAAIFAREEEYTGGGIDTAYADGDQVGYYACRPGDRVYAWLETGNNVAIGAFLESDGAGGLQLVSAGFPVAVALEAVNNASGSQARIKVQVL